MKIETLMLIVMQIVDALKREGYQKGMTTVRLLTNEICFKFGVERLSDLDEEQVAEVSMYLDVWEPSAAQRFRMRDDKI